VSFSFSAKTTWETRTEIGGYDYYGRYKKKIRRIIYKVVQI
jgi:hypothetical protein